MARCVCNFCGEEPDEETPYFIAPNASAVICADCVGTIIVELEGDEEEIPDLLH